VGSGPDYHIGAGPREGACWGVAPMFGHHRCGLVIVGEVRGTGHIPSGRNEAAQKPLEGFLIHPSSRGGRYPPPTMAARHWEDV
jgi:hypothetical protein